MDYHNNININIYVNVNINLFKGYLQSKSKTN